MSASLKKLLYILMILAGLAAALLVVFLLGKEYNKEKKETLLYTGALLRYDGWSVGSEGAYVHVNLPRYVFPDGNSITISNDLPKALESGTYLAFVSTNTLASVRVDGEEIYRNADSSAPAFSMWNYVQLNAEQAS